MERPKELLVAKLQQIVKPGKGEEALLHPVDMDDIRPMYPWVIGDTQACRSVRKTKKERTVSDSDERTQLLYVPQELPFDSPHRSDLSILHRNLWTCHKHPSRDTHPLESNELPGGGICCSASGCKG